MTNIENYIEELKTMSSGQKINDSKFIFELTNACYDWQGSDEALVTELQKTLNACTKLSQQKINVLCDSMRVRAALQASPDGYEEFVEAWTKKFDVILTIDRQLTMNGKDMSENDVLNKMILWTARYKKFEKKEPLKAAWSNWKLENYEAGMEAFKSKIAYRSDVKDDWELVVDTLLRDDQQIPNYRELTLAIFKGAIWRVKNKLNKNQCPNHIMPYLRGRQGCGKTSFMKLLLSPVQDGVTCSSFAMFEHDEKQQALRQSPVIFFDEVAQSQRVDANKLKNLMTSEHTMFRKLYGEATKSRIISTFFGAGNLELSEAFNDPTGLRRFFQIEVKSDFHKKLGELQSNIDPFSLWQCVDENKESPINDEIVEKLKLVQTECRQLENIELWMRDLVANGGTNDFEEVSHFWQLFKTWCVDTSVNDRMNIRSFQNQFSRMLKDQPEGAYPYEHMLHPRSRRSMYKIFPTTVKPANGNFADDNAEINLEDFNAANAA
jgi:predicted P-loop ATPase